MAYQPVPNVARVNIRYLIEGQQVENTLHFSGPGAPSNAALTTLAILVNDVFRTRFPAGAPGNVIMREVTATDLTTEFGAVITNTGGLPVTGTNVGAKAPNNVTFCIRLKTAARGRSGRGRFYIPWIFDSETDGSYLQAIVANQWVANIQSCLTNGASAGWTLVVVQRYNDNVQLPAGVPRPVISIGYSDFVIDSQRRRLPARGN